MRFLLLAVSQAQFHFEIPEDPKWPSHIRDEISNKFFWLKGTEWRWEGNHSGNVKFQKDGSFEANRSGPCQMGQCKWAANKDKVFVLWGEKGVIEMQIVGDIPTEQNPDLLKNLKMKGTDRARASFRKIFDFEAAEMDKDLYKVLGLEEEASDAEIKSAYRKLSLKYHPDKNPDEASRIKFNEVRDAYEILSHDTKKIMYGICGMECLKDYEKGNLPGVKDTELKLDVTLTELYSGAEKTTSYRRRIVCRGCGKNPDLDRCQSCNKCPNEVRMVQRQMGHMIIQQQEEVASKEKCKYEAKKFEPMIEKGMKDGDSITFAVSGTQKPGHVPGDVIYKIKQKKNKEFERKLNDLHMKMKISLKEALLGFSRKIKHLDDHYVEFSTTDVTFPEQVYAIEGEGMPLRDDSSSFGKLYIKIEIEFPTKLSAKQKELVNQLSEHSTSKHDEF